MNTRNLESGFYIQTSKRGTHFTLSDHTVSICAIQNLTERIFP